ncbi:cation efflux system transmembrane protein [Aromatoleum aromaticum EbN1]|uniref:Cation efflux system transmembrane protein n=1 Tax=Aromatoleum aromaticum (strain DSM 19018 / LMG 30748 / EbN1) TaxID=76114 RepID=Q5P5T7_AROAE|nr:efflux RND transporter periplasmic adaptor subunit [Aromatoleum aromaticum]CAI07325.1 cation efflux system transmembrane protein [Aromatoleum aromaticum EbN1]
MKPAVRLSLAALTVALALGAGYWAGSRSDHAPAPGSTATAAENTAAAAGGERQILYYRNPMGLPDTSPAPKKDSMGMDYLPVYADDKPDDSGAVVVSPARVQTLGVKTTVAEMRVVGAAVRAVGRIELNERAVVDVAPRFEGWIERLHVNAVGDPVRRGQPLFTIYSPELLSASEELRIAERLQRDSATTDPIASEAARRLANATRERLQNWQVAAAREGKGEIAQRQTFHSPANGVVLEKNAVQGARFMPGEAVYRIADLSKVWVIADIFERDLARVRVGQPASVTLDAFPDRRFDAKVGYLYPTLNVETRSTRIRLELDNREGLLRPGMFAHVELASGSPTPRVTVPTSAVIDDGVRQVVLIALDEGRFKPQPVRLGERGTDHVEVLEGVEAGDRVVTSANFLIDSESQLKAALSNLTDAAPATDAAPVTYEAEGTFDAVDPATKTVTLTHGDIPALQWPAMTMDFAVASPDLVANLAPGTPVRFEFEQRQPGEFVVTKVEKANGAKPAAANGHGSH